MHEVSNRTLGVPKSLAVAKPERQLYREAEGEGVEYDLYQHGRKRAKGHDGVAYPVLQVSVVWIDVVWVGPCHGNCVRSLWAMSMDVSGCGVLM